MRSYLKIPSLIMDGRRHSCGIIIFSNCQEFLEISIKRKSGIRVTVASKPHYSSQWINVSCLSKRYIHLFSACFAPFSVFCCQSGFFLPEIWYQDFAIVSLSMTATLVGLTPLFTVNVCDGECGSEGWRGNKGKKVKERSLELVQLDWLHFRPLCTRINSRVR